jgi:citrate lyase subunit beta/citryl-CoA lyase
MADELRRSWMFVPGHRQKMIDKALGLNHIDALMLDIEDGVPQQEKQAARQQIGASLTQERAAGTTPARFVRVSAATHEYLAADLAQIVQPGLDGLVLPKIETPAQIQKADAMLCDRELQAGLTPGRIALLIAIESPRGLMNAHAIATASPRVTGLLFGAEDFGKELGLPLRREGEASEMLFARASMANAAAAADVQAVDGVWPDLSDPTGLERYALQARRLGFNGMSSIHPGQIDTINRIFGPTADEVAYCQKVIEAFDAAIARGDGSIAFGGQLIDLPIVERAKRTVAFAAKLGVSTKPRPSGSGHSASS